MLKFSSREFSRECRLVNAVNLASEFLKRWRGKFFKKCIYASTSPPNNLFTIVHLGNKEEPYQSNTLRRVHTTSRPAKSAEQLGWAARLSNLKAQAWKNVEEADRLHHPVQLNGGKRQRKADQLSRLLNFHHPLTPTPITIAGPSNSQYCIFVKHFWKFLILKNVGRRSNIANSRVLQLWWGKLYDENRG